MEKFESVSRSEKYPTQSTPEKFDVLSLGPEHLDLYYIRHYVSEIEPKEISPAFLETQVRKQGWDEEPSSPAVVLDEYRRLSGNPTLLQQHPEWSTRIERIQEADYSHPVLIYKGVVIDGLHRILHALMDEKQTIPAHVLDALPKEAFITDTHILSKLGQTE